MASMSSTYGTKAGASGTISATDAAASSGGDDGKEYASARLLELTGVIGFNGILTLHPSTIDQ
jgi:hypothetical protein